MGNAHKEREKMAEKEQICERKTYQCNWLAEFQGGRLDCFASRFKCTERANGLPNTADLFYYGIRLD